MRHRLIAFVSAAICATSVFGQTQTSLIASGASGTAQFGEARFMPPSVTGAPYSGEEVTEQVQTLADGTHIARKSPVTKVYRDSLGRTRTERPLRPGLAFAGRTQDSPVVIEITDPVALVKYTFLDTPDKVAHRQQLPAARPNINRAPAGNAVSKPAANSGSSNVLSAAARPQTTREDLGQQTVEGVLAEGTRHTTTWPVDSQGNDRPISVVDETWMSPNLRVAILSKSNDPRSGEHTQKLTNISQGEPAASLFQPPPDYAVVDETGAFTIKWGSQQ